MLEATAPDLGRAFRPNGIDRSELSLATVSAEAIKVASQDRPELAAAAEFEVNRIDRELQTIRKMLPSHGDMASTIRAAHDRIRDRETLCGILEALGKPAPAQTVWADWLEHAGSGTAGIRTEIAQKLATAEHDLKELDHDIANRRAVARDDDSHYAKLSNPGCQIRDAHAKAVAAINVMLGFRGAMPERIFGWDDIGRKIPDSSRYPRTPLPPRGAMDMFLSELDGLLARRAQLVSRIAQLRRQRDETSSMTSTAVKGLVSKLGGRMKALASIKDCLVLSGKWESGSSVWRDIQDRQNQIEMIDRDLRGLGSDSPFLERSKPASPS